MILTGLSSATKSSRHSGNSVTCLRSSPSMNRFIRSPTLNELVQFRRSMRFHTALYGHRPVCQVDLV